MKKSFPLNIFLVLFVVSCMSNTTLTPTALPSATATFTLTPIPPSPTLTNTPEPTKAPTPTITPDPYGQAKTIIFDKWVVSSNRINPRGVYLVQIDQEEPQLITGAGYYLVDISPDLQQVLITDDTSLVVLKYNTQEKVILTSRLVQGGSGAYWSKNDNRIVYIARDDIGAGQIFTVNPDGTGLKQITPAGSNLKPVTLFPYNGNMIYYQKGKIRSNSISDLEGTYSFSLDQATSEKKFYVGGYEEPLFSPDGTKIAYGNNFGANIYLSDIEQNKSSKIFSRSIEDSNGVAWMLYSWSLLSKYILINDGENSQSYLYSVEHSSLIQLPKELNDQYCIFIGWSPDESQLLARFSPSNETAFLNIQTLEFTPLPVKMPLSNKYSLIRKTFIIP